MDARELIEAADRRLRRVLVQRAEDEVARARAQIKSGLLMGLEQASARCEQIAAHMFTFGRIMDTRELIAKIEAVDTKAVSRIAGKVLAKARLSMAALGPMGTLGSYDRIAQRFA